MISRKHSGCQIIKAGVTVYTLITLTCGSVLSQPHLMTCLNYQDRHATPSGHHRARTI